MTTSQKNEFLKREGNHCEIGLRGEWVSVGAASEPVRCEEGKNPRVDGG